MLNGFTRNFKPLEILTEEEVEAIWRGILAVLEKTGVRFEDKKALEILDKGGSKVDYDDMRVRFPPGLVTECLRKCPSSFRLEGRDRENDVVIGANKLYFCSSPGMQSVDLNTWEPREATRKEYYDAVTIYDALPNLHMLHGNSPHFSFEGVHPVMATLETFAARTRNSSKINGAGPWLENDIFQKQMADVVGARPRFGIGASPPLTWSEVMCSGGIRAVEAGFPMMLATGDIYGATAPATIGGAVVHNCATIAAATVLMELVKPGSPVIVANFTWPQNMRTGAPAFGNIAVALHDTAFNQVWRRYGIPVGDITAGIGNSKGIDFQNAYERGILTLVDAISGASFVWLHGCVHGELTSHPLQAILDDDIAGMIGHFIEGIEVNDETLAIDLIDEVGPLPGFYLDKEHTRKWWVSEQFIPKVADMLTLPEWVKAGKKTCIDYAKERMEQILATHKVSIPLTASQDEEIERILAEARKFYEKKGRL